MLPILRIIPVGGVLLAIMILVLSLSPTTGLNPGLTPTALLARGALLQINEHPEWRQFLLLAAVRRAEEINRLGELPDKPASSPDAGKIAGLPIQRGDADPDDQTGSIHEMPGATIPVEIGERSSTELPVASPTESPPVIRIPERIKAPRESRRKAIHHVRRVKPLARTPAPQPNGLDALFGVPQTKPIAGARIRTSLAPQSTSNLDSSAQPSQPEFTGTFGPH